jgi:hypothetical protein
VLYSSNEFVEDTERQMNHVSKTKCILIIGNGAAGSQLSAQLSSLIRLTKRNNIDIIVLSAHDFSEISLNMTKALVLGSEEHSNYVFPLYREPGIKYFIGSCQELKEREAITSTGACIQFDVCIVATGIQIPIFIPGLDQTEVKVRKDFIQGVSEEILRADKIFLVGGGPIGVVRKIVNGTCINNARANSLTRSFNVRDKLLLLVFCRRMNLGDGV